MDDLQFPESQKVTALTSRLKALEAQIDEADEPEEKISLLLQHASLFGEYNRLLVKAFNDLLTESVNRYTEALKLAEIFQNQMKILSGLLKMEQDKNKGI